MTLSAAARASAGLSLLFLAVYGSCNWLTSLRTDVGTWYFEWERLIPFIPLMIVPYMSIDLFFLGGPFLCQNQRELQTLTRRIVAAILVAGAWFLVMPLRFAFTRPEVDGLLGLVFNAFRSLDQPYNLFPSLHIVLRTILADLYARHTTGLLRGSVRVWFGLIGFSTVFTYQHHLVDVAGGFALAAVCFWAVRDSPLMLPVTPNLRVGAYYACGSGAGLLLALAGWPWTAVLLWPAAALAIVAAAYFGVGPGIFRKTDGRLPPSCRLILGPYLLGQHLSLLYYRRRCRAWDEVVPGLLIGRRLSDAEAAHATRVGVTAVLDLTAEFSEASPFLRLPYLNVPILDLTAPTSDQLHATTVFIAEHAKIGTVYVHCKIGYSRSAAVAGAYLLSSSHVRSVAEAVTCLRTARPSIVIRPEAMDVLRRFALTVP